MTQKTKFPTTVPDLEQLPFEIDTIECPCCHAVQQARVYDNLPFVTKLHICSYCSYVI